METSIFHIYFLLMTKSKAETFQCFNEHYRPQTKLREGNVFTHVRLSTGGGSLPSHNAMGQADPYPRYGQPAGRMHCTGMHTCSFFL